MTEVQLIDACRRKEPFAQRLLYEKFAERMYLLSIRYVTGSHDAEEVLSDAFLKFFNNIQQFTYQGEGSVQAWLSKIVVNECLMFLRKKKQLVLPVDETVGISDNDCVLDQLQARDLLKYIRELPTGYRTVLNLFVFEDLGHKEIAKMLQISENTSKSQLFKARALLKQKIQDGNLG